MTKRFRVLNAAIKYLATSAADDRPQAPAGSYLREYQDWRAGLREVSYTRNTTSNPDKLLKVAINPFGYTIGTANQALTTLSKRTENYAKVAGVRTAANIELELVDDAKPVIGFVPAKATVFAGTGTTTTVTGGSKITGVVYKKRNGASYTFPYGASSTNPREINVREAILTVVKDEENTSVSFTSERL